MSSNNIELKKALLSMHYREARPDKWVKPAGFALFSFDAVSRQWCCWFKNIQNTLSCWASQTIGEDTQKYGTLLDQLKQAEAWHSRIDVECSLGAAFESSVPDWEILLNE